MVLNCIKVDNVRAADFSCLRKEAETKEARINFKWVFAACLGFALEACDAAHARPQTQAAAALSNPDHHTA